MNDVSSMNEAPSDKNEAPLDRIKALSCVDLAALQHTARFRLSTPDSLTRRLFGGNADAAVACAGRLIQAGYLTAHHIGADLGYFALTPLGAETPGGLDQRKGCDQESLKLVERGAPTGRELAQAYGTLAFCTGGPALRERVLPSEIPADRSDLVPLLKLRLDFFVGDEGFGVCLVDAAGQHPLRLTRKSADVVHRLLACELFAQFHQKGRFVFALITADPATTQAVKGELRRWRLPLRPLIVTLPSLAQFHAAGPSWPSNTLSHF